MEVPGTGRARPDAGKRDALLTLKSRSFPGRVRAILETLLGQLSPFLEQGMVDALDAFEQSLFRRAEQARNNDEQQHCFESLREVRRVRSDIAPALMARFESALAALNDPRRQSSLARPQRAGRSDLALVDASELEESLALVEAANRAEVRSSHALFALGMRFAVLAEAPMFEAEDLPIGPHRLSECVRQASEHLELPTEHRVLFYRAVDQMLFARLDRLIEEANRVLIESRVLADLFVLNTRSRRNEDSHHEPARDHAAPTTPRSAMQAAPATDAEIGLGAPEPARPVEHLPRSIAVAPEPASEPAPPPAPPLSSSDASARFQQRAQQTRFGLATPAATRLAEAETGDSGRYGGFARPMTGWPGVPPTLPREPAVNDGHDRQVFQTMRDLLSGRRESLGLSAVPAADPNAFPARSDDLQSVLGVLQKRPAIPQSVGGKLVPRSIGHVKQDILNQLRQVTPEGRIPRLHEEDADTIDLVGLLFENLAKHATPNATVSQLMTKLQVPLLRVALRDKSFFTRRSHPARQLLNAVAESGLYWLDEGEDDRQLVDKMQGVVDHVLQEFQDDSGVFERVLSDLSRHLQTQAKKSEVAERRHVDAARGREKLESARHTAAAAIASRLGTHKPRALIRTLLEQAWTDVLALTVLRQGEDSPVYRERLAFVDDLVAFGRGAAAHTTPERRDAMRIALEAGLSQIGFHMEDIQAVGNRLFGATHGAANDDPATLTEVAAQLKAHSRFGEEGDHHAHLRAQIAHVDPPLGDEEQKLLTQLKTLPFGTWFEITQAGQKQPLRRKLSWFSTLTGRCLFVNQRGARSHETSLEQLARDIHEQRAKVYEEPQENLIDRAWNAIVRKLKSFTGQSATDAAEAT